MIDSIGFDLDGTLWSSMNCITKAWQRIAARHGVPLPTQEQMEGVMGLNRFDLMKKLYPEMERASAAAFFDEATVECVNEINSHGGILYNNVEEALAELCKHFKLYIVSNCQESYMHAFLNYHKLSKYFCDFAFENPQSPSKGDNIKNVIARNGFKSSVYIGDTQGDCDAAKAAGVPFGFASYGFGKVNSYDYNFKNFNDILSLIE